MLKEKIETKSNNNVLYKSFFKHFSVIILIKIIAFTLIYNLYFKNSKIKLTPKQVEKHLGLIKE